MLTDVKTNLYWPGACCDTNLFYEVHVNTVLQKNVWTFTYLFRLHCQKALEQVHPLLVFLSQCEKLKSWKEWPKISLKTWTTVPQSSPQHPQVVSHSFTYSLMNINRSSQSTETAHLYTFTHCIEHRWSILMECTVIYALIWLLIARGFLYVPLHKRVTENSTVHLPIMSMCLVMALYQCLCTHAVNGLINLFLCFILSSACVYRGVWKVWRGSVQVSACSQGDGQTFPLTVFLLHVVPPLPAGNAVLWPWWIARVRGVLCGESLIHAAVVGG